MTISFDSDRHGELIQILGRAASAIQAELDTLDTEARTLRAGWCGLAQAAYDQAHQEWSSTMETLRQELVRATAAAATAGDKLKQADRYSADLWS